MGGWSEGSEQPRSGGRRFVRLFARMVLYGTALGIAIVLVAFLLLQTDFAREKIRALIQTEAGKALHADLRIESLSGDLLFQVVMEKPVLSQNGQVLFSADRVRLEYAVPLLLRKLLFIGEIRIEGLRLDLVRRPDGSWNFESLVPRSQEEAADKTQGDPLQVVLGTVAISDGEISLLDEASSQTRRVRDLQLQVRPDLKESISAAIDHASFVLDRPDLTLSSLKGSVSYNPSSRTLSVDRLHLRTAESELRVNGKAAFSGDGPEGDLSVEMATLSLSELDRIASLSRSLRGEVRGSVRVLGKPGDLFHEMELAMGKASLKTSGRLDLLSSHGMAADILGTIQGLDPAGLPFSELSAYPGEINADFKLEGSRLLESDRKVSAALTLHGSRLAGYAIEKGFLEGVLDGKAFILREARVESPLGEVVLNGKWEPGAGKSEPVRVDLGARIHLPHLEKLFPQPDIPAGIRLELTSQAVLPRPFDLNTLSAKMTAAFRDSSVYGLKIKEGELRAAFSEGKVTVQELSLAGPAGRLHAAGTVFPLERKLAMAFDGEIPGLRLLVDQAGHLLPQAVKQAGPRGQIRFSGEIREAWERPAISGTVIGEKITFSTLHASRAELSGRFQGSPREYAGKARLKLDGFQAGENRFPGIGLEADIDPQKIRLEARVSHESGADAAFTGEVAGWAATDKKITLDALRISSSGVDLKNVGPIRASMKGQALHVDSLHLSSREGDFTATGSFIPGGALDANMALSFSRLDLLSRLWKTGPVLSGAGRARISLSGTPEAPRLSADLAMTHAGVGDLNLTGLEAEIRYEKSKTHLTASLTGPKKKAARIEAEANLAFSLVPFRIDPVPGIFRLEAKAQGFPISQLPLPRSFPVQLDGVVDLSLSASGTPGSPVFNGSIRVMDGTGAWGKGSSEKLSFSQLEAGFGYDGTRLSLEASAYRSHGKVLSASGTAEASLRLLPFSFQPGRQGLQVSLETERLQLADLLLTVLPEKPGLRIGGVVSARVQAAGDPYSPKITGKLFLEEGFFTLKDPPLDYPRIGAEISFSPDKMTIHRFSIHPKEEGVLSCTGQIRMDGFRPASFDLRLTGENFHIPFHRAIYARIRPDLTLSGPAGSPKLNGDITVLRGQVDIDRLSAQGPAEIRIVGEKTRNGEALRFPEEEPGMPFFMKPLSADVRVIIPKNVWLKGKDLNAEMAGEIDLQKNPGQAFILTGSVNTVRGTYIFQRKLFKISRGTVTFIGLEEPNPNLDVQALTRISGVNIIIRIGGTAKNPSLSLESEPEMPQNDIISYLMFGKPASQLRGVQSFNAEKAALEFTGQMAADQLKGLLSDIFRLDTLIIEPGAEDMAGPRVTVGKYVAPDVFVSYRHGFKTDDPKQLEVTYELTPNFSIEAQLGNERSSGVDFVWELDF